MASARELLEQADALMRRNRGRSGADIPVLTDVVAGVPANDEVEIDVPVLTDVVEAGAVDDADLPTAVQPSTSGQEIPYSHRSCHQPSGSASPIMSSRIVVRMQTSVRREFFATAMRCERS